MIVDLIGTGFVICITCLPLIVLRIAVGSDPDDYPDTK